MRFSLFGYCLVKEKDFIVASNSDAERLKLIIQNDALQAKVRELEAQVSAIQSEHPIIDVRMGDPSPNDSKNRRIYVAAVAGLHKDILGPKIKHMISNSHTLLSTATNTRDEDVSLKGAIYALWEIYNWGEKMVNEQMSYQADGVASPEN